MARLNYFFPSETKADHYEDNLTRAFLVVLRFSPLAQQGFYQLVREQLAPHTVTQPDHALPPLYSLDWQQVVLETQTGDLCGLTPRLLVSVLLSDMPLTLTHTVKPSPRNARYDGLLAVADEVLFIIENKPFDNPWAGQLDPAEKHLTDDTTVVSVPVLLEWRQMLAVLKHVHAQPASTFAERQLIDDFLEYVNEKFGKLNPFDTLGECRSRPDLLQRRVRQLLAEIGGAHRVIDHQGWGLCLPLARRSANKVGLQWYSNPKEPENAGIRLIWYPGNTMTQARALHHTPDLRGKLAHLTQAEDGNRWYVGGGFFLQKYPIGNFYWLNVSANQLGEYLDYWAANPNGRIRRQSKTETLSLLHQLAEQRLIRLDEADLKRRVIDKAYQTLDICPGLEMIYIIPAVEALALDSEGRLLPLLKQKMDEVAAMLP